MSTANAASISQTGAPVIQMQQATLRLASRAGEVTILDKITLDIARGETVAVLGPSGAGKTTAMMVMAGLEALSTGKIMINNTDLAGLNEDQLARLRLDHIGIVFQAFRLIPSMTAVENVAVPLQLAYQENAIQQATQALRQVGLGQRLDHLPDQLSGGEQQRVAIARAIVMQPSILLADEPTGNLDQQTGTEIMSLIFNAADSQQAALVLITHDETLASRCSRIIRLADGQLVEDSGRS